MGDEGTRSLLRPTPFEYKQPAFRGDVNRLISRAWGCASEIDRNPCPLPVGLKRASLHELGKRRYMVTDKSDGVRYLMCLGRHEDPNTRSPYCVLVGRDMRMFQTQVLARDVFFNGSVFDGELVRDKTTGAFIYLVFDVVMLKGVSVRKQCLERRVRHVSGSFGDENREAETAQRVRSARQGRVVSVEPGISLRKKRFYNARSVGILQSCLGDLPYAVDGIILMPSNCPVYQGTHKRMYKWKFNPTVDLEIRFGEEKGADFQILSGPGSRGKLRAEEIDPLLKPKTSFRNQVLSHHYASSESSFVVEAELTRKFTRGRLRALLLGFVRVRPDKLAGNSARTIRSVLSEAVDPIRDEELALALRGI